MVFRLPIASCSLALLALAMGTSALASPANDDAKASGCAHEVALRVQAWADATSGIEARFEQTTQAVALGGGAPPLATKSKGRVFFAKPGRMRWNYEEPEPSQLVSNAGELWIYDEAAGEVQHLEATSDYLNGAALQFLMGSGKLLVNFEVRARDCESDPVELILVPRGEATYERLGLRVKNRSGEVVETTLEDLLGNRTRIQFFELRSDRQPSAALFDFKAPEGVEVIEIRPRQ